jgi:TolB protein
MRPRAAVPAAALLLLAAACADGGECAGSPLMPLCEPAAGMQLPPEPHLVFQSGHEGTLHIYTMNSDGSGLRRLTEAGPNSRPAWSPDGAMIAFVSSRDGQQEIYLMEGDGGAQRNLTNHPAPDRFPSWSPDGQWLAFDSQRGEENMMQLFAMRADGSELRQLTAHRSNSGQPRWAPRGSRILFASDRGGWAQLYVANGDGSAVRVLTHEGSNQFGAWSPDGMHVVFEGTREMQYGVLGNFQIYRVGTGGADPTNLSQSSSNDTAPTWSRSGQIYFVSDRSGHRELWVMNGDGSGQRQLTDLRGNVGFPHAR